MFRILDIMTTFEDSNNGWWWFRIIEDFYFPPNLCGIRFLGCTIEESISTEFFAGSANFFGDGTILSIQLKVFWGSCYAEYFEGNIAIFYDGFQVVVPLFM